LKIKKSNREKRNLDWYVNFIFDDCFKLCSPIQVKSEILELLQILKELKPKYVLEIGTANGGSLYLLSRVSSDDACIISVDVPAGEFGGGYSKLRIPLYKAFCMKKQRIYLVRRDSHDQSTFEKIKKILGKNMLDLLFIDGDHSYEGIKKDFELYSPLVKNGRIIVFHDIVPHPPSWKCEVDRFWKEIKTQYYSKEIIENKRQKWAGIGLIRL